MWGPFTGVPFTGTLGGSSWDTGEGACVDLGGGEGRDRAV